MVWIILSGFFVAFASPFCVRILGQIGAYLLSIVAFGICYYFISFTAEVSSGSVLYYSYEWFPNMSVRFAFFLDPLSLIFAILISGIGGFIILYAASYLKNHPHLGRFLGFILAFMASMLGLVLANDIITLFVFWEATSITSFLLIGFDSHRAEARRAAIQALVVTGGGGLALLAGLILLSLSTGSLLLSDMLFFNGRSLDNDLYVLILLLILGGAFTKSAQIPFHFWLPNAMEAPTPVSAYLHSATMVKAGVYLLMRLNPVLGQQPLWTEILSIVGALTLVVGSILAMASRDLKRMLAYTTMASLGLLVLLIGMGSQEALLAAMVYLVAHSFFKGAFFMLAGGVDHSTGTRDIYAVSGLYRVMPLTAVTAALAALSMCGLPPFLGFVAKETMYSIFGSASLGGFHIFIMLMLVIGNALMLVIAASIAIMPFYGRSYKTPKIPHESDFFMLCGPVILALLGIVSVGYLHNFDTYFIVPALQVIAPFTISKNLHLWGGFNLALLLSIVTILFGVFIYLYKDNLHRFLVSLFKFLRWGPDKGFDQFVNAITRLSFIWRKYMQSGHHSHYLMLTFVFFAFALWAPIYDDAYDVFKEMLAVKAEITLQNLLFIAIIVISVLSVIIVLMAKTRLFAIVSLGIQGFSVAVIFMIAGAPDLSFTQFMVDTLAIVVLTLVMTRLAMQMVDYRSMQERLLGIIVSLFCGVGIMVHLNQILSKPFNAYISDYFNAYSFIEAHGRNIVNVIIVDFRAIDTLGEISVVMGAAIACLALVKMRNKKTKLASHTS